MGALGDLVIDLRPGAIASIAVVGAHCDDIAIGAGGALLALCRANPGVRVAAYIATGQGSPREHEERSALAAFCPGASLDVTIGNHADGHVPETWARAKRDIAGLRRHEPQLVIGPQRGDRHQDHRAIAEILPTEFRDHLILGYEILKWESDLPSPTMYVPLDEATATEKSSLLWEHYPSQRSKAWFNEETFTALARVRGVQCHAPFAEAFVLDKATISFNDR